jgi:DNA-binding MarR family transcriptional regulator
MAEIANILGVTRGAVQQTAGRLVKKGLVEKLMDENDRKRVYLSLTPKGKTAFQGHEDYHAELSSYLEEHFDRLRPREVKSLKDFFTRVESFIDAYNQ